MAAFDYGARIAVIAATLFALPSSSTNARSTNAQEPPREGCRAASKIEYDSAKRHYLLQNRFGMYVRTGRLWRHHYWYCRH